MDVVAGWWALKVSSRKGTSFISEVDFSRGMEGSSLSSASDSRKQDSFGGTRDEFELIESPGLLVSAERAREVKGDGALLFDRK